MYRSRKGVRGEKKKKRKKKKEKRKGRRKTEHFCLDKSLRTSRDLAARKRSLLQLARVEPAYSCPLYVYVYTYSTYTNSIEDRVPIHLASLTKFPSASYLLVSHIVPSGAERARCHVPKFARSWRAVVRSLCARLYEFSVLRLENDCTRMYISLLRWGRFTLLFHLSDQRDWRQLTIILIWFENQIGHWILCKREFAEETIFLYKYISNCWGTKYTCVIICILMRVASISTHVWVRIK